MCGIAGLIYRNGARNIGAEMTAMLQALKHRGPDSTGFAMYGLPGPNEYIMRFKVAEKEDLGGGTKIHRAIAERKAAVDAVLKDLGVAVLELDEPTEYANRYRISFDGDLKTLADQIEEVEGAEILSIGNALELIKDLGDAADVSGAYSLGGFTGTHGIGHTRMATESDVDIRSAHPYWAYPYNDIAVVHNGQITNYWLKRRQLEREGQRFVSDCDSELLGSLHGGQSGKGNDAGAIPAPVDRRDRRRVHLPDHDRQRTGHGQGHHGRQADGALRSGRPGRARFGRGRHPGHRPPRDRHERSLRRGGPGMAGVSESVSTQMGMHTEPLTGRDIKTKFTLENEGGFGYHFARDVDFNRRAEIDCADLEPTEINNRIRALMDSGHGSIVVRNPGAKHSLIVGILNRMNIIVEGSLGYFGCGLLDGPTVRISGRVGWSFGENMMAGVCVVAKNAGSTFGAALRGGDLVCKGSVGSRTGIDQKGGTILVGGDTGAFSGFMMQRGRIVVCGNAGKNLGDSMYDGTIFIGGEIQDLGVDAVPADLTDLDRAWLTRKLTMYEMLPEQGVDHFTKIVAGKQLWSYDNLEPTEKKLVL